MFIRVSNKSGNKIFNEKNKEADNSEKRKETLKNKQNIDISKREMTISAQSMRTQVDDEKQQQRERKNN